MLTRNGRNTFAAPGLMAGGLQNSQVGNTVKGGFQNRFVGGLDATFGGYANGDLAPSSFVLPVRGGAIASRTEAQLRIVGAASMIAGLPMNANGIMAIVGTSSMDVVFLEFMQASGAMAITQGTVTLGSILQMLANGSMVLSSSSAILSSALSLIASGQMTLLGSATLGGVFGISASSGSMRITGNVVMTAIANMVANGGGPEPLSPQGLANAVWFRQIDGAYSAEEILRILVAVAAGRTDITDLGGGAATVIFRDLSNTLNRVSSQMQSSERVNVIINPA